ncbi:hypothetical protein EON62_01195, partial [archaeon]
MARVADEGRVCPDLTAKCSLVMDEVMIAIPHSVLSDGADAMLLRIAATGWVDASMPVGTNAVTLDVTDFRLARSASPGDVEAEAAGGVQGWPAWWRLPHVSESDMIKPFPLTLHASMRPECTLAIVPVPITVPGFMSARVGSTSTLIVRAGLRDLLLINDSVGALQGAMTQDADALHAAAAASSSNSPQLASQVAVYHDNAADVLDDAENEDFTRVFEREPVAPVAVDAAAWGSSGLQQGPAASSVTAQAGCKALPTNNSVQMTAAVQASIAIPCITILLVNDLCGMLVNMAQFSIEDARVSALGLQLDDRLIATAAATLRADYYNITTTQWEPLIERWSVHVKVLKPQPLITTAFGLAAAPGMACQQHPGADVEPDTEQDADARVGVGLRSINSCRVIDLFRLYALEDDINSGRAHLGSGAGEAAASLSDVAAASEGRRSTGRRTSIPSRTTPNVTPSPGVELESTLPKMQADDRASETPSVPRHSGTQQRRTSFRSVTGALFRTRGIERAVQDALELMRAYDLPRVPYVDSVPEDEAPVGLDTPSLPADVFVNVSAKKSLEINLTHAFLNTLLDSFAVFSKLSETRTRSELQKRLINGGVVHVRNDTELRIFAMPRADTKSTRAPGSGRAIATEAQPPVPPRLVANALEQDIVLTSACVAPAFAPLVQHNAARMLTSACMQGISVMSAVLYYSVRKDDWFRGFAALSEAGTLYLWEAEPAAPFADPPSAAAGADRWMADTCDTSLNLQHGEHRMLTHVMNPCYRPPTGYVLNVVPTTSARDGDELAALHGAAGVAAGVHTTRQQALWRDVVASAMQLPPVALFALSSSADYDVWLRVLQRKGLLSVPPSVQRWEQAAVSSHGAAAESTHAFLQQFAGPYMCEEIQSESTRGMGAVLVDD